MAKQPTEPTQTNRAPLITADQLKVDFEWLAKEVADLAKLAGAAPSVIEDDEDLGLVNQLVVDIRAKQKSIKDKKDVEKRPHLDANAVLESFFSTLVESLAAPQAKLRINAKLYLDKKVAAERTRLEEVAAKEREEASKKAAAAADAAAANRPTQASVATIESQNATARADTAQQAATSATPAELARTKTNAGTASLKTTWKFRIDAFAMIDLDALRIYLDVADVEKALRKYVSIHKDAKPMPGVTIYPDTEANIRG